MTLPALFLPGILLPARLRYERLFGALGDARALVTKELEVYREATPPAGYSIAMEVEGIARLADERGWSRFHLYGHSGGGACALAFAALHPERVATLALDEPAFDFSDASRTAIAALVPQLDRGDLLAGFVRTQVRDDVQLPPPPSPPPPWMTSRPAGIAAIVRAFATTDISIARLATFASPVYYSYGTLSNPRWGEMAHRLVELVPQITVERFDGRHHLDTSHVAEPERVARALRRLWLPD